METGLGKMSKYLHLLAFNYLKNILKNFKFKNKYVKKYARKQYDFKANPVKYSFVKWYWFRLIQGYHI